MPLDMILDLTAGMAGELGLDPAEAKAQRVRPRGRAEHRRSQQNRPQSIHEKVPLFQALIPGDSRPRSSLRARGAFSRRGETVSAAPERSYIARASAKHFATSLAIEKTASPPHIIGSCLVRANDGISGSPALVTTRGPWVPSCRAMTIPISEPALIVRRTERSGPRWPPIRRTASQLYRRAPLQARR
jgi:hypothetical protein